MMILTHDRRVRFWAASVLAGMFGAGVAVGFVASRGEPASPAGEEVPQADRDSSPPRGWIIDRLDLTSDQRAGVDSVVAEYRRRMSDLQREYRPSFRQMMESANRALMEILTEEQRIRYDSIDAAAESRRERRSSEGRR